MAAGDDDLARKALVRKKEAETVAAALRDQQQATADASQTLRRQLEAMQAKLADAERRLGTLAARKRAADVPARMAGAKLAGDVGTGAGGVRQVRSAEPQSRDGRGRGRSPLGIGPGPSSLASAASLDNADENVDIEAELLELKSKKSSAR